MSVLVTGICVEVNDKFQYLLQEGYLNKMYSEITV